MKFAIRLTTATLAMAGAIGGAQATSLIIDTPTGSVDVTRSFFAGTLLDFAITDISNQSYQGIARTAVYDTGTGLDFYYQFSNASTSTNGVERFSAWDFSALGGGVVDVFQTGVANSLFAAGTVQADTADRSARGVIGFNFVAGADSKIKPGSTSFVQVIRTNARYYQRGNFGLLNGIGDNAAGFGVSPIPEPQSLAMMLAGLGLMVTIAARRRKLRGPH